ncbi:MAG: substrate-binding periplasmic protein [Acutalibacteraceae bacterium]
MKKILSLCLVFSIIISAICFTSCKKSDEKVYTFSLNSDSAPFVSSSSQGSEGINLDLLPAICQEAGIKYTISYDGQKGNTDFYMTEEEKGFDKNFSFTVNYFNEGIVCAVKDTSGIASYEELIYTKIGVLKDNDSISFANEIAPQLCLELKEYSTFEKLSSALDAGKIDGVICPYSLAGYSIANSKLHGKIIGNVEVTKGYSIYTKSSRYSDVIKKINEAIKTIKKNGKYNEIIERHLGKISTAQPVAQ